MPFAKKRGATRPEQAEASVLLPPQQRRIEKPDPTDQFALLAFLLKRSALCENTPGKRCRT